MNIQYNRLENGPIDEIDAAIWSGDMFHDRENIASFRAMMARWEQGLQDAEELLDEVENPMIETKIKEAKGEITNYLSSGGLFNPELANHDEVRNLLIELRDLLDRIEERI